MKILVLAAKLIEVPDDWNNVDNDLVRYDLANRLAETDIAPYETFTTVFPTRKGFFTYWALRLSTNVIMNWVRPLIDQPLPVQSHPRQMWLTPEERDAYDESLQ